MPNLSSASVYSSLCGNFKKWISNLCGVKLCARKLSSFVTANYYLCDTGKIKMEVGVVEEREPANSLNILINLQILFENTK